MKSIKSFLKRILSFALGLVASVGVSLLVGSNSELFEDRTVISECVNNTINKTSTVWYKNEEVINNAKTRNLTLTLKSSDAGLHKCGINGMKSTNSFTMTVKGMSRGVF